jgi:hypothetical protein
MFASIDGGSGEPVEPDWASIFADELDIASAKEHWRDLVSEMRSQQTLSVAVGHMIYRTVMFRVEFDRSARAVAEKGKILRAKRTKTPAWNLEWQAMGQAAGSAKDHEKALGVSPDSRTKAGKVQRGKKAPRAADGYLRTVPK